MLACLSHGTIGAKDGPGQGGIGSRGVLSLARVPRRHLDDCAMSFVLPPSGLRRVAAIVEYDGSIYEGLQWQPTSRTIQGEIENAIRSFKVEEPRFRASGRTDSGVHARGQVVAVDMPESLPERSIVGAVNWHLPEDIRFRRAVFCDPAFDPRSDARLRTYRYLLCGGQPLSALMRNRMGRARLRLDLNLMKAGAEAFLGEHEFRAWRSTLCQAKRTRLLIQRFEIDKWRDRAFHGGDLQTFEITIACRSFLHRMVRFLVGGIVRVGSGELSVDDLKRHLSDETLPPRISPVDACGLSLERVDYVDGRDPFVNAPIPGMKGNIE